MAIYSVSYDLKVDADPNYDEIITEIKSFNGYRKVMKSHWFVCHSGSANQVYEKLKRHLNKGDHILVMEATKNYQGLLPSAVWDWLKKHM